MDIAAGTLLCGKFEIVRALGTGGTGSVFEARHLAINKPVAVKVLAASTGGTLARREALGAAIRSPHVVDIYDIAEDESAGLLVVVMELLEGANLQTLLNQRGPFAEDEALTVLRQVIAAIHRAHERGVVHGDLKPGNIFAVDREGEERIVLLDFGIASLQASAPSSLSGSLGGTPLWMNPEAVQGGVRTWRADTWALGLLAYWMITGKTYWRADAVPQLLREIVSGPGPSPSQLLPTVPSWLDPFFSATVNRDETKLLPPRELLDLLPKRADRVPRRNAAAKILVHSQEVDELGTTAITAAAVAAEPVLPIGAAGDSLVGMVTRILPESMRHSAPEVSAFVEAVFADAALEGRLLKLRTPKLNFAAAFDFFLVALGSARPTSIQTQTFLAYTRRLEELLASLEVSALKVVIVLVDTTALGMGVRARIADLFRNYKAALIPAFVGDIASLRGDAAREWLRQRWQANRPVTNPFEPRVLDRTLLHGQVGVLNKFLEELSTQPAAFGVYGAPGSGKTSLVRRVESELKTDADFRWISCGTLPRANLASELLRRAAEALGVEFREVNGRPVDVFSAAVTEARRRGRPLVVVLDESDALVDPSRLGLADVDRDFLLDLRQQFAYLLEGGGVSFVFVGLRSFMLGREQIAGLTNPLRRFFRSVRVPPFELKELEALCSLGRQVDLLFEKSAVERVQYWASGNVHVAQLLCAQLLEMSASGRAVRVQAKEIDSAAAELVAARQSFERRLMPWLTEPEKNVLATVPRVAFKRPLDLAPVLPGMTDDAIGNALDGLVEMGVLTRPGGKTQVAGKLLEAWVKTHMSPPVGAVQRTYERRMRTATIGVFCTALLYGLGLSLLGSGQDTTSVTDGSCVTTALVPKRVVLGEKSPLTISRGCTDTKGEAVHDGGTIEVRAIAPAIARFESDGGGAGLYAHTIANDRDVIQDTLALTVLGPPAPGYELTMSADGHAQTIELRRNWLGELPAFLRGLIVAAGAIPALIGLFVGFYGDIRRVLEKLVRRSPVDSQ